MSLNRISTVLAGALSLGVISAVSLTGTASAEPTFTPVAGDVVGVGSDTSQFAMNYLADGTKGIAGYNANRTSGRLVSFDALGENLPAEITLRQGTEQIARPNGSSAGKKLLYGAGDNVEVNYARSSSALSDAEREANLQAIPFAVDGLKLAVSAAATNAPAAVTPAQMVGIYDGTIKDWSEIGGKSGAIVPLVPQSGSGTRAFFLDQLKAANGGVAPTLAASVKETQEHSDADIKGNPNAIAPFSTGRAKTAPTVTLLSGGGSFKAERAMYNVVRQADLDKKWVADIFLTDGFICSPDALPLIEAAGFLQLADPADGGVCGEPTQSATTNFTTTEAEEAPAAVDTATTLASQVKGRDVTLIATVTADGVNPEGTVQFRENGAVVRAVGLSGGKAVATLTGVTAGKHTYVATFVPTDEAKFGGSISTARTVTVKLPSSTTVSMDKRFSVSERVKAVVKVTASGTARGAVQIKDGARKIAKVTLAKGKAGVKLPKLKAGKHRLTFKYLGNATTKASKATVTVTVTRR